MTWWSMMSNLSDVYYLAQLIVRQVSIYLRDVILYKFFWLTTGGDDPEVADSKLRGFASRNVTADIMAFSIICIVLFLLVIVSSKCEKEEEPLYPSEDVDTLSPASEEDPYRVSSASSSSTNYFHACGDSVRDRMSSRNLSNEDFTSRRSCSRKKIASLPKRSIFGLNMVQSSQSTQTERMRQKLAQRWLIRRTRSGQIYGKYPV